jgi:hypothetical protein
MLPFLVDKNWYERYWYGEPESPRRRQLVLPFLAAAAVRARNAVRLVVDAAQSVSAFGEARHPSDFGGPVRPVAARVPRRRYGGLSDR